MDIDKQSPGEVLEFLQHILASTEDLVSLLDKEGSFIYLNRVVPGLSREQVIGTKVFSYVPANLQDVVKSSIRKCLETDQPVTYQTEGTGPNGKTSYYLCRLSPCVVGGKRLVLCVATDITEQKTLERKLLDQIKELETLNHSMVDREVKMSELKDQLKELKKKPPKN